MADVERAPVRLRTCVCCHVEKPETDFHRRGEAGRRHNFRSMCKACSALDYKRYANDNAARMAWLHKMKNVEKKYGVTREWYCETLAAQDGRCKVCEQEFVGTRGTSSPSVDHCHSTGAVRGLICNGCNLAIGSTRENPNTLRLLARYLENA